MAYVVTLFDAVTGPGDSAVLTFPEPRNVSLNVMVTRTGTPTDIILQPEESVDGITFVATGGQLEVNTSDKVLPNPFLWGFGSDRPIMAFKITLVSMSGGTSPTVSAKATVVESPA